MTRRGKLCIIYFVTKCGVVMRLDLLRVLQSDGAELPFRFELDLSDLDFRGQKPFTKPARVEGRVVKSARQGGRLTLDMEVVAQLEDNCDRCGIPVSRTVRVPFFAHILQESERSDAEDAVFLDGHELDLGPIAESAVVLEYPTRLLCSEDCRGLCHRCGADLNEGPCGCGVDAD